MLNNEDSAGYGVFMAATKRTQHTFIATVKISADQKTGRPASTKYVKLTGRDMKHAYKQILDVLQPWHELVSCEPAALEPSCANPMGALFELWQEVVSAH